MREESARVSTPGGAIVVAVLGVLAVGVIFLAAMGIAAHKTSQAWRGWEQTLGTHEEILQRFPTTDANGAALELERLSAALGIDLATRSFDGRDRPTEEAAAEHKRLKSEIGGYLTRQLEQPGRAPGDPAPAVTAYLEAHADDLDALRGQLVERGMPHWEMQLERLFAAPIPNLLGHIDLQKLLLVDALVRSYAGDDQAAIASVDAAWHLNRSLRDDPILITQLVSIAATRMQAGTLRQLDHVPAVWRQRLLEHDFRRSFLDALSLKGWMWMQLETPSAFHSDPAFWTKTVLTVARPYVRFCLADVSEDYRQRLVNLAAVRTLCDDDLALHDADLNIPIPWWNEVGEILVSNLANTLDRLARLELDLEMTAKLIDLRTARAEAGDRWPESVPGINRSSACPEDHWNYDVTPDGGMTLAFAREISWPNQIGVVLPTRYSAAPE